MTHSLVAWRDAVSGLGFLALSRKRTPGPGCATTSTDALDPWSVRTTCQHACADRGRVTSLFSPSLVNVYRQNLGKARRKFRSNASYGANGVLLDELSGFWRLGNSKGGQVPLRRPSHLDQQP
jgi:hypothetical protein